MARRPSLKPQLNQIRTWVGEGVTDIWIAHQLDTTPAQIAAFRRQQGLLRPDEAPAPARAPRTRSAAKATPAEAAPTTAEEVPAKKPRRRRAKAAEAPAATTTEAPVADAAPADDEGDGEGTAKRRRRGRRGGRGRSRKAAIPATIEQTPEGLVIRIDAAVLEQAAFAEHWSGRGEAVVAVTATAITLGPAPDGDAPADDADALADDADAPADDDTGAPGDDDAPAGEPVDAEPQP